MDVDAADGGFTAIQWTVDLDGTIVTDPEDEDLAWFVKVSHPIITLITLIALESLGF